MFETRWRIFFTGGGQKARGKKISKSKKKKRNISPGCDHPGGEDFHFFFSKNIKGRPHLGGHTQGIYTCTRKNE